MAAKAEHGTIERTMHGSFAMVALAVPLLASAGCRDRSTHAEPTATATRPSASAPEAPLATPDKGMAIRIRGGKALTPTPLSSQPLSLALGGQALTPKAAFTYHLDDQRAVYLMITWLDTTCEDVRAEPLLQLRTTERDRSLTLVKMFHEPSGWRVLGSYAPAYYQGADRAKVQIVSGSTDQGATLEARVDLELETSEQPPRRLVVRGDVKAQGCGSSPSGTGLVPRELFSTLHYNGIDLGLRSAVLRTRQNKTELILATAPSSCEVAWGAAADVTVVLELGPDGKAIVGTTLGGALFPDALSKQYPPGSRPFRGQVHGAMAAEGTVEVDVSGQDRVGDYDLSLAGTVSAQRCGS